VAKKAALVIQEHTEHYCITLSHHTDKPGVVLEQETPTRYAAIDFNDQMLTLQHIIGPTGIIVPVSAKEKLSTVIQNLIKKNPENLEIRSELEMENLLEQEPQQLPHAHVILLAKHQLNLHLFVQPAPQGAYFKPGQGAKTLIALNEHKDHVKIIRDFEQECKTMSDLIQACPHLAEEDEGTYEWTFDNFEHCCDVLSELKNYPGPLTIAWPKGSQLSVSQPLSMQALNLSIKKHQNWFECEGVLKIDEQEVITLQTLLHHLDNNASRFVPIGDNKFLALTEFFKKQLLELRSLSESHKEGLKIHPLGAFALQNLIDEAGGHIHSDSHWKERLNTLAQAQAHTPILPSTLQAPLRDYQHEGFQWLSYLAAWGVGACLADDMGLGKTLQALALILERVEQGPCLVIAPTSVCYNWQEECLRFAPSLNPILLSQTTRSNTIMNSKSLDLIICSYGLLQQEQDSLSQILWGTVILDEAQAIKNNYTKRSQAAMRLQAKFKCILSGTPVENHLSEIWNLFNFINPGLLGSQDSFQKRFTLPIERNHDPHARHALKRLIQPFILRRTKAQVLEELPPKTEKTIFIDMDFEERHFYEALRRHALENLAAIKGNAAQKRVHILSEITRLRRACGHPSLVQPEFKTKTSGKLTVFEELVQEIRENQHKVLVFSQYLGLLSLAREILETHQIPYQYLDGSTPTADRQKAIHAFQAGQGDVFLISLKAGGTGLNLTAADYIIHLDPWWNPAVEDQASNRAHRIGQQRPVTVYRLIMKNTIEERIIGLHADKRNLATDLLEGQEISGKLSEQALLDLIKNYES
jgi:SNF2 family DNA or RNA helicase